MEFEIADGVFMRAVQAAFNDPMNVHVLLLDELNRSNVPKVFGDLITLLEASKRVKWTDDDDVEGGGYWDYRDASILTLPNSGRKFCVPDNLLIIGTMNTTDRSVAPIDSALRRRFAFVRLAPMVESETEASSWRNSTDAQDQELRQALPEGLVRAFGRLNEFLAQLGADAVLGHSYLYALAAQLRDERRTASEAVLCQEFWAYSVLPQVVDHFETLGFQNTWIEAFNGDGFESMRSSWEDLNVQIKWPRTETRDLSETRAFKRATVVVTGPPPEPDPLPIIQEPVPDEASQEVWDVLEGLGVQLGEGFNAEGWVQRLPHLNLLDAANLSDEPSLEEISTAVQNSESAYDEWVNARLTGDAQNDIDSGVLMDLYVQYRELGGLDVYDSMEALREACEALEDN